MMTGLTDPLSTHLLSPLDVTSCWTGPQDQPSQDPEDLYVRQNIIGALSLL